MDEIYSDRLNSAATVGSIRGSRMQDGSSGGRAGTKTTPGGTNGALPGTNGARGLGPGAVEAIYYAGTVAAMAVIVMVNTATQVSDRRALGVDLPVWESLLWEVTSAAALLMILPAVTWLARRIPWDRRPLWGTLLIHLVATAPFSLAHVALMDGLRWAAYLAVTRPYDPLHVVATEALYEYRKDLITYAVVVGVYWAWRRLAAPPRIITVPASAAEGGASEPALEVRDGARRIFVQIAGIVWIEAAGNYAELHLASGASRLHRAALSSLEAQLAPHGLVRIHRSRLVARAQIAEIIPAQGGDFTVKLRTGETLNGSRRFREGLFTSGAPAAA
jgi:DNA-binding LytR/AlgR family response regulator